MPTQPIKALPTPHTTDPISLTCSICADHLVGSFDEVGNANVAVRLLGCGHVYHKQCILSWAARETQLAGHNPAINVEEARARLDALRESSERTSREINRLGRRSEDASNRSNLIRRQIEHPATETTDFSSRVDLLEALEDAVADLERHNENLAELRAEREAAVEELRLMQGDLPGLLAGAQQGQEGFSPSCPICKNLFTVPIDLQPLYIDSETTNPRLREPLIPLEADSADFPDELKKLFRLAEMLMGLGRKLGLWTREEAEGERKRLEAERMYEDIRREFASKGKGKQVRADVAGSGWEGGGEGSSTGPGTAEGEKVKRKVDVGRVRELMEGLRKLVSEVGGDLAKQTVNKHALALDQHLKIWSTTNDLLSQIDTLTSSNSAHQIRSSLLEAKIADKSEKLSTALRQSKKWEKKYAADKEQWVQDKETYAMERVEEARRGWESAELQMMSEVKGAMAAEIRRLSVLLTERDRNMIVVEAAGEERLGQANAAKVDAEAELKSLKEKYDTTVRRLQRTENSLKHAYDKCKSRKADNVALRARVAELESRPSGSRPRSYDNPQFEQVDQPLHDDAEDTQMDEVVGDDGEGGELFEETADEQEEEEDALEVIPPPGRIGRLDTSRRFRCTESGAASLGGYGSAVSEPDQMGDAAEEPPRKKRKFGMAVGLQMRGGSARLVGAEYDDAEVMAGPSNLARRAVGPAGSSAEAAIDIDGDEDIVDLDGSDSDAESAASMDPLAIRSMQAAPRRPLCGGPRFNTGPGEEAEVPPGQGRVKKLARKWETSIGSEGRDGGSSSGGRVSGDTLRALGLNQPATNGASSSRQPGLGYTEHVGGPRSLPPRSMGERQRIKAVTSTGGRSAGGSRGTGKW